MAYAQTYSVIHTFTGADGAEPLAGVTLRGGSLYGTTSIGGGERGYGTVYELTPFGDNWVPTFLFVFTSAQQGRTAMSRPVFGPDGHLYGTTQDADNVFRLTPPITICRTANCFWTLDSHTLTTSDGPGYGDLVFDQQGNIYGTTQYGGPSSDQGGVFELSRVNDAWVETPLYYFRANHPPDPGLVESGVIFDKNGNLFGTAIGGGQYNNGPIYELKYVVGVGWQESNIYSFSGSSDGEWPSGITFDSSGNIFGVTPAGGVGNGGVVFELSPSGDTWAFNVIYSFTEPGNCYGRGGPARPLTIDAAGNLYGTTGCDGAYGSGSVFKLTKSGNTWVYSSLYDFTGGADGATPLSTVTIDTEDTLYGTASSGGSQNSNGVVWMIKP